VIASPLWLDCFDLWAREAPGARIARELVHKHRDDNVLLARLEAAGPDTFAVQLHFDPGHPFFFEHPVGHVPGLALIEAGRQAGLAVAHRFYGVPVGHRAFFINDLNAAFTGFAALDAPVFGIGVVSDVRRRGGELRQMTYSGHYLQGGRSFGTLRGTWTVVAPAVLARLEQAGRAR
jgi:2-oxo-3-(phosphooxy)propyl 3-oxoalkanoate synthase